MKIEKIILKEGEKKPKSYWNCEICDVFLDCIATGDNVFEYGLSIHPNCPIVEQPAITDPETLDNTLSQNEELDGYEFVQGVGGCVDCDNCEIPITISCPESCASLNGYYIRKTE